MGFLDEFMGTLGPDVASQMAKSLNIDADSAMKMIPQVAPLILGGLKRQKDERGGDARVDHILNKYGSASVLDDIAGLVTSKAQDRNPDPKLGGLLGDSGVQAANMLSNQFNLSGNSSSQVITMLAPLVLGFLTKKRDTGGAGSSGIGALLDQDGDGSVLDDVAGFLMKGLGGGAQGGSDLIGGLLGGLFGGKK